MGVRDGEKYVMSAGNNKNGSYHLFIQGLICTRQLLNTVHELYLNYITTRLNITPHLENNWVEMLRAFPRPC